MARVPAGIKKTELVELLDIDEQIKTLDARRRALRDKAMRAHGEWTGTAVYGDVVLTISEAGTFDPDAFAEQYPYGRCPEYYSPTVVKKAVPEMLVSRFLTTTRRLGVKRAKPATAKA